MAKKPTLTAIEGPLEGQTFILEDGFVIGRDEACEITTNDKSTSRRHAQVNFDKDGIRIADLGSANGLFVNERQIKSHHLAEGDEIVLGDTKFSYSVPADPAAQRRKFLITLVVIVLIGGAGLVAALRFQQEQAARTTNISLIFSETYTNDGFGFEVNTPIEWGNPSRERSFVVRRWDREVFGRDAPVLGDRLVTDKVILDGYWQVQWFNWLDDEFFEYFIAEIEVWDGIAEFQDIFDFPLSDTSLPTRRAKEALFTEAQTVRKTHPELGTYYEGEKSYPKGVTDNAGNEVQAYILTRCYVVGNRRFLVSLETNLKDKVRTKQVFSDFHDSFTALVSTYEDRPDKEMLEEGLKVMDEAQKLRITGTPNAKYRSLLSYMEANRLFKQLTAESREFTESLEIANALQRELSEMLVRRRDTVREQISRQQFPRAGLTLEDIVAIVEDNEPTDPRDEQDPWRIWHEKAKAELNLRKNLGATTF